MGDVIPIPTHKGSDETNGYILPAQVLKSAQDANLDQVIVLGWQNDEFYAASSTGNIGDSLYMIERFKEILLQR